jgi:hypothetical protein
MSAVEHYTSISCTTYLERIEAFRPVELADEKSHVRPDCPVWIPLKVQSRSLTKAYGHLRYIFTIGILLLLICFKWPSISCLGNEEECDDEDCCGQASSQKIPVSRANGSSDGRCEQTQEGAHDGLHGYLPHEECAALV